jgi:hypothetical protein
MSWTNEQQQRFDALRLRELHTPLSSEEQRELDGLFQVLERAEEQVLGPALARLTEAQRAEAGHLRALQQHGELLALMVQQHERACGVSVAQEYRSLAR